MVGVLVVSVISLNLAGQNVAGILKEESSLTFNGVVLNDSSYVKLLKILSFFSLELNRKTILSSEMEVTGQGKNATEFRHGINLQGTMQIQYIDSFNTTRISLSFRNVSQDTIEIDNLIPFGTGNQHVYTYSGTIDKHNFQLLALPGKEPVPVFLPGRPGEIRYAAVPASKNQFIYGFLRGTSNYNIVRNSPVVFVPPGKSVLYYIYLGTYSGRWSEGIKKAFHENQAYDLASATRIINTDYETNKHFVSVIQYPWNKSFFDSDKKKYTFYEFLEKGEILVNGYDMFILNPVRHRAGLDPRSQYELYDDLPWGIEKLRELAGYARHHETMFFITWQHSGNDVSPGGSGMVEEPVELVNGIKPKGIFIPNEELSTNQIKGIHDISPNGVPLHLNFFPLPSGIQNNGSVRINSNVEIQPVLNLGRLLNTGYPVFRVVNPGERTIHRDVAVSFFNGQGTELDMLIQGSESQLEKELEFLGKTTTILRENNDVFSGDLEPLIEIPFRDVYVNKWRSKKHDKEIFTLLSFNPSGLSTPFLRISAEDEFHYVDLLKHEEIHPVMVNGSARLPVSLDAFQKSSLNTPREGTIGCIGSFAPLIKLNFVTDSVFIQIPGQTKLEIWKNAVDFSRKPFIVDSTDISIALVDLFPPGEKLIFRLFDGNILVDERIHFHEAGLPVLVNYPDKTKTVLKSPAGMVEIPSGIFIFSAKADSSVIPFPSDAKGNFIKMPAFYMDKYPVTNSDFYQFLVETGYKPEEPKNFLKHWKNGTFPKGQDNYPVVWISIDDAMAYAAWKEKRLPTEAEWQYAAQGTNSYDWPWGEEFHATKCNNGFGQPTPVDAFPKGASVFGVEDLVGNVWQLTNDIYDNGFLRFVMIRGGAFYKPESSTTDLMDGGPMPVNKRQRLILVSPGFDRSPTIGFRCVKDKE